MPPSVLSCLVKNPAGNSDAGEVAHCVLFSTKEKEKIARGWRHTSQVRKDKSGAFGWNMEKSVEM